MRTIDTKAGALSILLVACVLGGQAMAATTWNEEAAYTDGEGKQVGGRYVHAATGLPIRILRIESVPQVFMHFNTPPISDRGEPHTQEHLLLGKGGVGKAAAAKEAMSLVGSTAYTAQTDTCYSFHCDAGKDTFFDVLQTHLHAMLFPDYTDEEIRREVWHVGVVTDQEGKLDLEERGTIYNEMVTTYEKRWNVFYEIGDLLYGDGHPYSYSAGGEPTAIREMTPEHIHAFHRSTYHLSPNMGLIVSLPPSIPTNEFLTRFGKIVDELAAMPGHAERPREQLPIPPVQPSEDRTPLLVPYPNTNEEDTGTAVFCWPPATVGDARQTLLRQLFLEALAGGETSVLHGVLLDPERREMEVEATAVWGGLEDEKTSEAAMVGLSNYGDASADELQQLAARLSQEATRVAGLAGGSEDLASFNRKVETRLLELERELKRKVSEPPRFGYRRSGGFWLDHLRLVDRGGGEARALTLDAEIAAIRELLAGDGNPWQQVVADLGMEGVPYSAASVPSAAEVQRRRAERTELLRATREKLEAAGNGADPLQVLQTRLATATAELEARDEALPAARLVDDIPLTLDDTLVWKTGELESGTPTFRAHFETMSAVDVTFAFDVARVSADELKLLPLLPSLLTGVGLRGDDETLRYDELQDALDRETGGIDASYETSPQFGRYELTVTAAGVDAEEIRRTLTWLERCLHETNLSISNLERLRTVADQLLGGIRSRLGGAEEGWVRSPSGALRYQRDHLYLSTSSLHTRLYHLWRLRWLLAEWPDEAEDARQVARFLDALRTRAEDRHAAQPGIDQLLEQASGDAEQHELLESILASISGLEADLPADASASERLALVEQLDSDLRTPPAETVRSIRRLFHRLLSPDALRLVLTGRPGTLDELEPVLAEMLERRRKAVARALPTVEVPEPLTLAEPVVLHRVRARSEPSPEPLTHLGLVNEKSGQGVFVHSVEAAGLDDLERDTLISELAAAIYAGAGPHAFFMNTWSAGLAYSNGASVSASRQRASYYAERCPDLVQTMQFVVELAKGSGDLGEEMTEYAIARLVTGTRASDRFEARARAQAADLEDGITPERVAEYRQAILALRKDEHLWADMRARIQTMTGRTLVGLGARSREQPGGVFLTIAPERLLAEYEDYVQQVEADYEQVHRIYPADFWIRE